MGEEKSSLLAESPVVLIDVDKVEIFELTFIIGEHFDWVLEEHFPIGFIHHHNPGVVHCVLISHDFLTQELVVDFILLSFGSPVDEFA